jgi:adenine-specific DNA-methyltransferase
VRYIGNKTKLLGEIEGAIRERGLEGGIFLDIFAGTASVARHFKQLGWQVVANDRMQASYVQQVAALEVNEPPPGLGRAIAAIEAAPDAEGLVTRQYSPAGPDGRCFFTPNHARRIDAALETLARWHARDEAPREIIYLLLAAVIEAADRVANISGTYGAFLKTWQANTRQPFRLRVPAVVPSVRASRAHRADANALVREVACDVLYVDPPYNSREYCANYHVLEAIAERPFLDEAGLVRLEAEIYGKTGLRPYERSAFCNPRTCRAAFRDLIAGCRAREVVVSYNEEGILSRGEIEAALRDGLGAEEVEFRSISCRRFRSDSDGARRRYKVIEGRGRDEIHEWLLLARRRVVRAAEGRAGIAGVRARPACAGERVRLTLERPVSTVVVRNGCSKRRSGGI